MRVRSLYRMRKRTEKQILKNKTVGYIDKRDCQIGGLFFVGSVRDGILIIADAAKIACMSEERFRGYIK